MREESETEVAKSHRTTKSNQAPDGAATPVNAWHPEALEAVTKFLAGHRMPARSNLFTNPAADLRQMLELGVQIHTAMGQTQPGCHSLEAYVLQEGQPFLPQSLTREERSYLRSCLARYREPLRPRECYYNAQMLLLSADSEHRLCYCEGFGLHALLTPHAWLALDGKLIDVTWKLERPMGRGPLGSLVLGRWNDLRAYQGVMFAREQIREFVRSRKYAGSLLDDPRGRFPLLKRCQSL